MSDAACIEPESPPVVPDNDLLVSLHDPRLATIKNPHVRKFVIDGFADLPTPDGPKHLVGPEYAGFLLEVLIGHDLTRTEIVDLLLDEDFALGEDIRDKHPQA